MFEESVSVKKSSEPEQEYSTKKLWTYIKSKGQDNIGGAGSLDFQGDTHIDSLIKANIFADYFSSVYTNEDISYIPSMEGDPLPCIDAIQL